MTDFRLPDLGEGLREAEIVDWLVAPGDTVAEGQPLVSVETDKAVVEIPSPQKGTIAKLAAKQGDHLPIGAVLVVFEDGAKKDAGTVVGELPTHPTTPPPKPRQPPRRTAPTTGGPVKAAPAVRALAARLGVDLAGVTPSGPGSAVLSRDVEQAAKGGSGAERETAEPASAGFEPLSGVRRAMARNMARAGAEIVPATVTDEADISDWPIGSDVTLRLIRAIAAAATAEPALNAWYDGRAMARRLHDTVDLGIAMQTPDGLFVPVLRDVGSQDAKSVRQGLNDLKDAVTSRSAAPETLRGATITLSNFGTLGGRHAALVVVPPQVAIVGAGRVGPAIAAIDGMPAVRTLLPLSLTFDHRAVTGAEAAHFLAALIADLEQTG